MNEDINLSDDLADTDAYFEVESSHQVEHINSIFQGLGGFSDYNDSDKFNQETFGLNGGKDSAMDDNDNNLNDDIWGESR